MDDDRSAFQRVWESGKEKAGAVIGLAFFAAIFGSQCVLPFVQGNPSETFDCDSDELQGICDESGTTANFSAVVCGRDDVSFQGELFRAITLGEGRTPSPPPLEAVGGQRQIRPLVRVPQEPVRRPPAYPGVCIPPPPRRTWTAGTCRSGGLRSWGQTRIDSTETTTAWAVRARRTFGGSGEVDKVVRRGSCRGETPDRCLA